jgi:hypothetical protein
MPTALHALRVPQTCHSAAPSDTRERWVLAVLIVVRGFGVELLAELSRLLDQGVEPSGDLAVTLLARMLVDQSGLGRSVSSRFISSRVLAPVAAAYIAPV